MRAIVFLLIAPLAVPLAAQVPRVTPFQEQKARALLRDHLPCLGCHELGGAGGRTAPSLTSVAERRSAAYIRAIIEDPQRVVPGAAMPRVAMPPATRELVVRYVSRNASDASGGVSPTAGVKVVPEPPHSPAATYAHWCASCHGERGGGDGPNAKYLPVRPAIHSSAAQMRARSDDVLFDAIAGGGAVMGKSARMPPFGATLAPGQIRSLVAYIRTLCACHGPAWSLDGSR